MRITKGSVFFAAAMLLFVIPAPAKPQGAKGPLANVKSIKCTFTLMAVGTWGDKGPDVKVKAPDAANREMQFDSINADEGTAELQGVYGKSDIIVRYQEPYLHFIQSFLDGHLYTTTVIEKKTAGGKFKAMHSRHEFTDFALVGFTSSPEQYYGDCEILK
jgi:hypothetical protein